MFDPMYQRSFSPLLSVHKAFLLWLISIQTKSVSLLTKLIFSDPLWLWIVLVAIGILGNPKPGQTETTYLMWSSGI